MKVVKYLQHIKKKVLQLFLCSIVMQNIKILYGIPIMFDVTCFWMVVVKNGRRLLKHEILKFALSQE